MTEETFEQWESSPWAADHSAAELEQINECETTMEHTDAPGSELQAAKLHRVAGRIYKLIEAQRAVQRHGEASAYQAATMLSAGGRGTGRFWTTTPQQSARFYDDAHFHAAVAQRLGAARHPAKGAKCRLRRGDTRRECA